MAQFASYVASQDGILVFGVWATGLAMLTLAADGAATLGGLYFSGLPTSGSDTSQVYRDITLTVTQQDTNVGTLNVYVIPQAAPAVFSNTNLPAVPPRVDAFQGVPSLVAAFPIPGTASTYQIPLDVAKVGGLAYRKGGFGNPANPTSGAIAFVLQWLSSGGSLQLTSAESGAPTAQLPTLSTDQFYSQTAGYRICNIDSGRSGYVDVNSRMFRCHKSGFVRPVDDLVEDGYFKGLLVLPELYDDPEPPKRPPTPERPSRR